MNWVKVLAEVELPQDARKVVKAEKRTILLLHHGGQIYAMENACPHLKLPLQGGKVTADNAIVCPWHHSAFDLLSGNVKDWCPWPPGVGKVLAMVSKEKALTVFPTRLEEGSIWVGLEE
ncbi:(2Fe-2S)-binding protein [Neosynechococcus sphagnicola sy1]|uniref:(2Fe-2S)-binding protein n=1 Tax=Neosynechococcus sphagnicola sy1 TaxID=1497020 RepID=A0A098TME2_9CYAN|nr:Rieske (2Fe-2S) protein [Neosynechococcus sphagnicola]KGF73436.1 (2Fe-2S)-binding protein [Neosynechococcus sphagnicola sy1]